MVVVDVVDVVVPAAAVPVAVAVAAVTSAAVTAVVVAAVIVVVADIVLVVVGSDVEAKARRPTCRLYWFYSTSCIRSGENTGVADVSCIMLKPWSRVRFKYPR